MKKRILAVALIAMGIIGSSQAADQFMGDGAANPITTTASGNWDTTSSIWLPVNDGMGVYGTWVNGNNAHIFGNPIATITDTISVGNIVRGNETGALDIDTSGAGHFTMNGSVEGTNVRQINLGSNGAITWEGSINLSSNVNRCVLDGVQTITAPSTIYTGNAGNVIRFLCDNTDLSNLTIALDTGTLDDRAASGTGIITIAGLTGHGTLTDSGGTGDNGFIVNNLAIGAAGSAAGIGAITATTFDNPVVLGSGTHSFDIDADTLEADLFSVGSSVISNSGTLTVTLTAGTLGAGDLFNLFDAASFEGSFSAINLPPLTSPLFWDTSSLDVNGSILVLGEAVTNYTGAVYLGDGADSYVNSPVTWDTTSSLWGLGPNAGFTAWTNWINGGDAIFYGDGTIRVVDLAVNLDALVDELVWNTLGEAISFVGDTSQTLTVTNQIRTDLAQIARQITFKDLNLGGSFTLANVSRLSLELGTTILPGTEILAIDGSDVRLNGTTTDFSDLSLTLGSEGGSMVFNQSASDKTIGFLGGTGEIRVEGGIALTLNNVTVGGTNNVSAITDNSLSTGNLVLGSGTHEFNINPDTTKADLLDIGSGSMTLGGDLVITATTTNKVALGDTFKLLGAGTIIGSFNSVVLPESSLPAGLVWHNNLETDGTISVGTPGIAYETVNFTDFVNVSTWVSGAGPTAFGSITNGQGTIFTLTLTNVSDTPTDPVWLYTTAIAGIKGANGNTRLDSFDATPGVVNTANDEALLLELSISGTAVDSLGLKSLLLDSFAVGEIAELSDGTSSTQFLKTVASEGAVSYEDVLSGLTELTEANVDTWKLKVTSRDNNNDTLNTLSLDEIKFLVGYKFASDFEIWASSFGLVGGPNDDDDNDGLTNLGEYGQGGDPTNSADRGILPVFGAIDDGGGPVFEYIYSRRTDDSTLAYHLETTPDLIYTAWTDSGYTVVGIGPDVGGFDTVTNQTPLAEDAKFIRVIIEQN